MADDLRPATHAEILSALTYGLRFDRRGKPTWRHSEMMAVDQPAPPPISPEQLREARELLGWSRDRLAVQSDTTAGFIGVFEDTGRVAKLVWHPDGFDALAAIRTALETAGITFTNGDEPGAKLKRQPE